MLLLFIERRLTEGAAEPDDEEEEDDDGYLPSSAGSDAAAEEEEEDDDDGYMPSSAGSDAAAEEDDDGYLPGSAGSDAAAEEEDDDDDDGNLPSSAGADAAAEEDDDDGYGPRSAGSHTAGSSAGEKLVGHWCVVKPSRASARTALRGGSSSSESKSESESELELALDSLDDTARGYSAADERAVADDEPAVPPVVVRLTQRPVPFLRPTQHRRDTPQSQK